MAIASYKSAELYPNSPLVEVVCEVRFPISLAVEGTRDKLYGKIRAQYPRIIFPGAIPGQPSQLQQYRFEKSDESAGVMLAVDRFSYYEKKYRGHQAFIAEMLRLYSVCEKSFALKQIERVGWRYINIIPFAREGKRLPLGRLLSVPQALPGDWIEPLEYLSLTTRTSAKDGTLTSKLETAIRKDTAQEALILDFDYGMTNAIEPARLKATVIRAHNAARKAFESFITAEYRSYLRGEGI